MSFIINKPHKIPRVNLSYDIMLGNSPKHIFDTKIQHKCRYKIRVVQIISIQELCSYNIHFYV